jgi:GntR family transcriptional regulator, transcriptional repressor for pyruvate dehydrogenase complex
MNSASPPRLQRKRLSEELTSQLRRHILEKGLKPGDALLTEQEMMARFGVSRTVVREATKALDFLGIIDAVPSRGMVLDQFDFNRVNEYFGFHLALSNYPREQLLKARMVIETGSLYYVMEAMKKDPAVYAALRELAEGCPDAGNSDKKRLIEHDIAFHRALVEASGIAPLASFCDLLQAFFREYRHVLRVNPRAKSKHFRIIEALQKGKLDRAVDLLRCHLRCYEKEKTTTRCK